MINIIIIMIIIIAIVIAIVIVIIIMIIIIIIIIMIIIISILPVNLMGIGMDRCPNMSILAKLNHNWHVIFIHMI